MFEGGFPEQFHQFMIGSSRTSSSSTSSSSSSVAPLLPLSFPDLHATSTQSLIPITSTFEYPYPSHSAALLLQLQPQFDDDLPHKQDIEKQVINNELELESRYHRSRPPQIIFNPWTNDEVLELLRIRSSLENWLPDFTWEHVSRKLAELGYRRRSGEICKLKFEEESNRHFDSVSSSSTSYTLKNFTRPFFSELEQLYHGENSSSPVLDERHQNNMVLQKLPSDDDEQQEVLNNFGRHQQISVVQGSTNETLIPVTEAKSNSSPDPETDQKNMENKKRKRYGGHRRRRKFEMLKGFCEDILKKMMAQQEELHNKIIEDMLKREEDKIAREEAWKKHEIERVNMEVEIRAREQAVAGDRQTKLIELLKNFTSTHSLADNRSSEKKTHQNDNLAEISKGGGTSFSCTSSSLLIPPQNPNPICHPSDVQNPSLAAAASPNNPNEIMENENPSPPTQAQIDHLESTKGSPPPNPDMAVIEKEMVRQVDTGKRWPRDEVLALINLRWSHMNNNNGNCNEDKELEGGGGGGGVAAKGPLWERISQEMLEVGYKRSAKRCKEKWENINKYFRKTKDVNKKRSVDSRTCPYFHQLNKLYGQGTTPLVKLDAQENHSATVLGKQSPTAQFSDANYTNVGDGGGNLTQLPDLDFEF